MCHIGELAHLYKQGCVTGQWDGLERGICESEMGAGERAFRNCFTLSRPVCCKEQLCHIPEAQQPPEMQSAFQSITWFVEGQLQEI